MKENSKKVKEALALEAKRLDKVLSRYKMGNGIVTAKNFTMIGGQVSLQGSELQKVGTGYIGVGDTVTTSAKDLVDQVEKELAALAKRNGIKPAPEKAEDEPEASEEVEAAEETEEAEEAPEAETSKAVADMTVAELKAEATKRGISIPRGAVKEEIIDLLS